VFGNFRRTGLSGCGWTRGFLCGPRCGIFRKGWADTAGIALRADFSHIGGFLAANPHERSRFEAQGRRSRIGELVAHHNRLSERRETDPSLKIEIAG